MEAWGKQRVAGSCCARSVLVCGSELERIESSRIFAENFFNEIGGDVLAGFHGGDELGLFGWIVVTIVRTYEDVILTRMLRDVRNVFVRLAAT
jgi:hypothetical protein